MTKLIPYTKLISSILIWASLYHVARTLLIENISIFSLIFLRYGIATVVLFLLLKLKTGKIIYQLNIKQIVMLCFSGCFGISLYNIAFLSAESLVSGDIVAIMFSFAPCITVILSIIFLRMKINAIAIFGFICALIGTIGVINYATPSCGEFFCLQTFTNWNAGIGYSLLAAVCFAINAIIVRQLSQTNLTGLMINSYSSFLGLIIVIVVTLIKQQPFIYSNEETYPFMFAMLYTSLFATVLAYLWYTESIVNLGILKTVIFQNTLPLWTVIIGFIFFNDILSSQIMICGVIVIFGVITTNIGNSAIGANVLHKIKRLSKYIYWK